MKKSIGIAILILVTAGCKSVSKPQNSKTMNLENLHTKQKAVQTQLLFEPTAAKVVALQIAKNEQLKEHVTKVPALLVCVSGDATFSYENGEKINLKSGDFIKIPVDVKHWVDAHELSNFLLIK